MVDNVQEFAFFFGDCAWEPWANLVAEDLLLPTEGQE